MPLADLRCRNHSSIAGITYARQEWQAVSYIIILFGVRVSYQVSPWSVQTWIQPSILRTKVRTNWYWCRLRCRFDELKNQVRRSTSRCSKTEQSPALGRFCFKYRCHLGGKLVKTIQTRADGRLWGMHDLQSRGMCIKIWRNRASRLGLSGISADATYRNTVRRYTETSVQINHCLLLWHISRWRCVHFLLSELVLIDY